jgi:hypothetical protein
VLLHIEVHKPKYNIEGEPSFKADRANLGGIHPPTPLPISLGALVEATQRQQAPLLGFLFLWPAPDVRFWGAKQTSTGVTSMSAYDPKRTFGPEDF